MRTVVCCIITTIVLQDTLITLVLAVLIGELQPVGILCLCLGWGFYAIAVCFIPVASLSYM